MAVHRAVADFLRWMHAVRNILPSLMSTTTIHTCVLNRGPSGVLSPSACEPYTDRLDGM